jgi:hypothetical protein
MICRKYSFQKLPQFSQGNNLLDADASDRDGSLPKDTCVSSTQLDRPTWREESLSPLRNTLVAKSIPFKN